MKRIATAAAIAALAACGKSAPEKKGPFVAEGNGVAITAEEFKARLDEQSPFIRSRYSTLDRKKEFLDNLIRFEVLAREATRQGLDKDPDVLLTMKKVIVQKLVQKNFADLEGAKNIPDAELQTYYDQHRDEYVKPLRLRLYHVLVKATAADKAKKQVEAKKILERVKSEEKKNALAFTAIARERSEDDATKNVGGDLNFRSRDDLEKLYGKAAADAVIALKDGEVSGVVESPLGFHVFKVAGRQEAFDRPFEQVKAQIAQKLYREKKTREFDEFVKKLREQAAVKVNDAELEKVAVLGAPPPGAGMAPMPGAGPGGGFGASAAPPQARPAPPAQPAPAPAQPAPQR